MDEATEARAAIATLYAAVDGADARVLLGSILDTYMHEIGVSEIELMTDPQVKECVSRMLQFLNIEQAKEYGK